MYECMHGIQYNKTVGKIDADYFLLWILFPVALDWLHINKPLATRGWKKRTKARFENQRARFDFVACFQLNMHLRLIFKPIKLELKLLLFLLLFSPLSSIGLVKFQPILLVSYSLIFSFTTRWTRQLEKNERVFFWSVVKKTLACDTFRFDSVWSVIRAVDMLLLLLYGSNQG